MELKTLKDIEKINLTDNEKGIIIVIRKEAIKWVKEDRKYFISIMERGLIFRWMKRFNITEEDLNENT